MRGTLDQTLSRRNTRVAGTVVGCLLVLVIAQLHAPALSSLLFLAAAGLAHAYVMRLYFVTSVAGTVMALLQAHLTGALGGFAVAERLADTVIGALLAWAFSYVLPSWERRGAARNVARLLSALGALAEQTLRLPADDAAERSRRLARREAYDALGAVAAITQRTRAEPRRVRVPVAELATLIAHGHALLAQLTAVKVILARRRAELPHAPAEAALLGAAAEVRRLLDAGADGALAATTDVDDALASLAASAALPWLQRRLRFVLDAAAQVVQSAAALKAAAARSAPHPR